MTEVHDLFYIQVSSDQMIAEIYCTEKYSYEYKTLSKATIMEFVRKNKVTYGIKPEVVTLLLSNVDRDRFPLIIAKGRKCIHGEDGRVSFKEYFSPYEKGEDTPDFRDMMRIPSIKKGEEIATTILPTKGLDGLDVFGGVIQARHGKSTTLKAGENVVFNKDTLTYHATMDGQLSIMKDKIHVYSLYEVNETLSLKIGDIDVTGSVSVKGNVPTGFTIKAKGDIYITGIVEEATIIAGGSIYITEGLTGLDKGYIQAGENIYTGYINRGTVYADQSIYVEHSVVHSKCHAKSDLHCKSGSIIGGMVSIGRSVVAKDIGNRAHTKTIVSLGLEDKAEDSLQTLQKRKKELEAMLKKLTILGEKLADGSHKHDAKMRLALLRQKHSHQKTFEELEEVNHLIIQLNNSKTKMAHPSIIVESIIYSNTIISFGKYEQKVNKKWENVCVKLEKNDIVIRPLK